MGCDASKPKGHYYNMKIFSGKILLLGAASILAGTLATTASATTINGLTGLSKSVTENGVFYTAHGKTDRKTAKLFKHLMENNSNLQIHAEVEGISQQPSVNQPKMQSQSKRLPVEVLVNYTIHGKTDMKTVRKFIKLFKNNKHVEITANISKRSRANTQTVNNKNNDYYNQPANAYTTYQPSYNYPDYSYNGYAPAYAPVYAQGYNNQFVWVPVAVVWGIPAYAYNFTQPQYNQPVASDTTDQQLVLASN